MSSIATTAELRAWANVEAGTSLREQWLQGCLDAAEAFVELYTGRQFATEPALVSGADTAPPVSKVFHVRPGRLTVPIPDLRSVSSVVLDGVALVADLGYHVAPGAQPTNSLRLLQAPSRYMPGQLVVTGRWGWNPPPADIKDAVLRIASRKLASGAANYSDQVVTPDGSATAYYRQLDGDAQMTLNLYRVPNLAVVAA